MPSTVTPLGLVHLFLPHRAAALICALLLVASGTAQLPSAQTPSSQTTPAQKLTIRLLNARTNQPIPDERLNVAFRADQIGSVALATDKNGLIVIDLAKLDPGKATTLRVLANMYADCRPRAELYTDYSLATLRASGITAGNLCSGAHPAPRPGQLLLYEIPKTFIPTFGKPPNTTLPRSDENPNLAPPPAPKPQP